MHQKHESERLPSFEELLDASFEAFEAEQMRSAAAFLSEHFFAGSTTVGLTLTRKILADDLGLAPLYPLLERGYVDWIVLTSESLGLDTFRRKLVDEGPPSAQAAVDLPDRVRVLDQILPKTAVLDTEEFVRRLIESPPFQKICSSAVFYDLIGRYLAERERLLRIPEPTLLSCAFRSAVPVFAPYPGASFTGSSAAAAALTGNRLVLDAIQDVNEVAALVFAAKRRGPTAILSLGGGTPERFALQAARHLGSPLGLLREGHDFLLRIKNARPGEPRQEARTVESPESHAPRTTLGISLDPTFALPLLAVVALERCAPRPPKRLLDGTDDHMEALREAYLRHSLERQQQEFQERVRSTVHQLQQRVQETHEQLQQRVQETQEQFQSKVTETRQAIQSELHRAQRQLTRLLQQASRPGRQDAGSPDEDSGTSRSDAESGANRTAANERTTDPRSPDAAASDAESSDAASSDTPPSTFSSTGRSTSGESAADPDDATRRG